MLRSAKYTSAILKNSICEDLFLVIKEKLANLKSPSNVPLIQYTQAHTHVTNTYVDTNKTK